jgi:hypothetical protein
MLPSRRTPKIGFFGALSFDPSVSQEGRVPSIIRTIPSAPEFHRILRNLRSRAVTAGREWSSSLAPCPEG